MIEFISNTNIEGKVGIRSHHIRSLYDFSVDELRNFDCQYMIGTPDERNRFFAVCKGLSRAIVEDNFFDLGQVPDAMCNACVSILCPVGQSYIMRTSSKEEICKREAILKDVESDLLLRWSPEDGEKYDYICRRVDELWVQIKDLEV
jgi:hypothetical protein